MAVDLATIWQVATPTKIRSTATHAAIRIQPCPPFDVLSVFSFSVSFCSVSFFSFSSFSLSLSASFFAECLSSRFVLSLWEAALL